jgi:hypothetical protein
MTEQVGVQKKWETYLLYQKYLSTGNLPEAENKKLIDGLADIIAKCHDNSLEPDKIYLLTEQFRKRKYHK